MAEGQRSPNATEARLSRALSWQHGSGVGRIYPQLDFGAGCFNEHRMRRQNAPGAAGEGVNGPGRGVSVPRLREGFGCSRAPGSHPEPQDVALSHPTGGETLPGIPGGHTGAPGAATFGV